VIFPSFVGGGNHFDLESKEEGYLICSSMSTMMHYLLFKCIVMSPNTQMPYKTNEKNL